MDGRLLVYQGDHGHRETPRDQEEHGGLRDLLARRILNFLESDPLRLEQARWSRRPPCAKRSPLCRLGGYGTNLTRSLAICSSSA
jgi:hypothetical protein